MDKKYAEEFRERLPGAVVPQLFAAGVHLGDYETIFGYGVRFHDRILQLPRAIGIPTMLLRLKHNMSRDPNTSLSGAPSSLSVLYH
jgi:hypothetical protein